MTLFTAKLKNFARRMIEYDPPDTLNRAFAQAEAAERAAERDRGSSSFTGVRFAGADHDSARAPVTLHAVVQPPPPPPLTPEQRMTLVDMKACFYCKRPESNHLAFTCPSKLRGEPPAPMPSPRGPPSVNGRGRHRR